MPYGISKASSKTNQKSSWINKQAYVKVLQPTVNHDTPRIPTSNTTQLSKANRPYIRHKRGVNQRRVLPFMGQRTGRQQAWGAAILLPRTSNRNSKLRKSKRQSSRNLDSKARCKVFKCMSDYYLRTKL